MTKSWRTDIEKQKNKFLKTKNEKIPFIPELALACYAEVSSEYHNSWQDFLKGEYLYIDYDELIQNQCIDKIENYFNIKIKNTSIKSIPMARPQTEEYIDKLKDILKTNKPPSVILDNSKDVYKELIKPYNLL